MYPYASSEGAFHHTMSFESPMDILDTSENQGVMMESGHSRMANDTRAYRLQDIEECITLTMEAALQGVHLRPCLDAPLRYDPQSFVQQSHREFSPKFKELLSQPCLEKKAGLFTEIDCVWVTMDKNMLFWQEKSDVFCHFNEANGIIVAVDIVRPKHCKEERDDVGDFVVVIVTQTEVILFPLYTKDDFISLPGPVWRVDTRGTFYSTITTTKEGRIFLGGSDGVLAEALYANDANTWWTSDHVKLVKHFTGYSAYLTSVLIDASIYKIEEVNIRQMVVSTRPTVLLHALIERGSAESPQLAIETWHLGQDGFETNQKLVTPLTNGAGQQTFDVFSIHAGSGDDMCDLILITPDGERLTYGVTYGPNYEPIKLSLIHTRLLPADYKLTGTVINSFYRNNVIGLALRRDPFDSSDNPQANESDVTLVFIGPDYSGRIEHFSGQTGSDECYTIIPWEDSVVTDIQDIGELPMPIRAEITILAGQSLGCDEIGIGRLLPNRLFSVITNNGVSVYEKVRPCDAFVDALKSEFPVLTDLGRMQDDLEVMAYTVFYAQLFQTWCDRSLDKNIRILAQSRLAMAVAGYNANVLGEGDETVGLLCPTAGLLLHLGWVLRPLKEASDVSHGTRSLTLFNTEDHSGVYTLVPAITPPELQYLQNALSDIMHIIEAPFEWPVGQEQFLGTIDTVITQVQEVLYLMQVLYYHIFTRNAMALKIDSAEGTQGDMATIFKKMANIEVWELLWQGDLQMRTEALLTELIEVYMSPDVLQDLRVAAPHFFSNSHFADQVLQHASNDRFSFGEKSLVDNAIQTIASSQVTDNEKYLQVCLHLKKLHHHRRIVEISLELMDTMKYLGQWTVQIPGQPLRLTGDSIESACYLNIFDSIFSRKDEDANIIKNRKQALELAVNSGDPIILDHIYNRLIVGSKEDADYLLTLKPTTTISTQNEPPYLEKFLEEHFKKVKQSLKANCSEPERLAMAEATVLLQQAELVWVYHAGLEHCITAAKFLEELASLEGDIPFKERKRLLSLALPYAKQTGAGFGAWIASGDERKELLSALEEKARVLQAQENMYFDIKEEAEMLERVIGASSPRATELRQIMRELKQQIFDVATLYNDYAMKLDLTVSQLELMKVCNSFDMKMVKDVWKAVIAKATEPKDVISKLVKVKERTGGIKYWGRIEDEFDMTERPGWTVTDSETVLKAITAMLARPAKKNNE